MVDKRRIAIVDIETTGPHIEQADEIIQIAAVIIEDHKVVAEHSMFINPGMTIPSHIQQLTGIRQADVEKAPSFDSVAGLWYQRLKDCFFVAHNLGFDLRILKYAFKKHLNQDFEPQALDSVVLAKILMPQSVGYNLTDLSQHFNLDFSQAHDALSDARITTRILTCLSQRVQKISSTQLAKVLPMIDSLAHDELLFFSDPQAFMLESDASWFKQEAQVESKPKSNSNLAEFITDSWNKHPHLVIEDNEQPFTTTVLFDKIIFQESSIIYSLPTKTKMMEVYRDLLEQGIDDKIALLKPSSHYLNKELFARFLKQYAYQSANQQELVVVLATFFWQLRRSVCDLDELNNEINIQGILQRYSPQSNSNQKVYQQVLQQAKQSSILLTYDVNINQMVKSIDLPKYDFIKERRLIILDMVSWLDSLRFVHQLNFSVTDLESRIMAIYDSLYRYRKSDPVIYTAIKQLKNLQSLTHRLIAVLGRLLDETEHDGNQQQQLRLYVNKTSTEGDAIHRILKDLIKGARDLYNQLSIETNQYPQVSQPLKDLQLTIQSFNVLNNFDPSEVYMTLEATRVHQKFYNQTLTLRPLVLKQMFTQWLQRFQGVLIASEGNYYNYLMTGTSSWVSLPDNFHYQKLPSLMKEAPIPVILPMAYMEGKGDRKRLDDMLDLLLLEPRWPNLIVYVMPNLGLVRQLYQRLLQSKEVTENFHVYAQGVTGNLNKIRRRILETRQAIVIVRDRDYLDVNLCDSHESMAVKIYNLPFQSPMDARIQAEFNYLKENYEKIDLFDDILLPDMIRRMKQLINHTQVNYPNAQLFLLDQRLFSKHYSRTVVKALDKMVSLMIED